ncbi:hypothetical protein HMSSN036_90580 [Paenibacillus macerans]|nr:hypothetical protein HMSSN036_90580 [Paenibacillus macerans]
MIDTVDMEFGREFADHVTELINPLDIQYIVINHTEPDHSGGLAALAARATNATIVCTEVAVPEIQQMYKLQHRQYLAVKDAIHWISAAKRFYLKKHLICTPKKR